MTLYYAKYRCPYHTAYKYNGGLLTSPYPFCAFFSLNLEDCTPPHHHNRKESAVLHDEGKKVDAAGRIHHHSSLSKHHVL